MSFAKMWSYRHYFFKYIFFQSALFILSFKDSDNTNVRYFTGAHCAWDSLIIIFSAYFFLCCSDWFEQINIHWFVFTFIDSSVISNLPLILLGSFLNYYYYFSYYIFSSIISLWFFIFSISLLRYLIFHLRVFIIAQLNICIISTLKSFRSHCRCLFIYFPYSMVFLILI